MKSVSTITRQKFAKHGIRGVDLLKVVYPEDYQFNFITEDRDIHIERAQEVLPEAAYNIIMQYDYKFGIEPGSCHKTASLVSYLLKEYGVQLCDGYYALTTNPTIKIPHSFCKVGDRYFDPTIEFVFSPEKIEEFIYHCVRVFEPAEYALFAAAAAFRCDVPIGICAYTSTLAYEPNDEGRDCQIDDDGHFIEVMEPYYNCYTKVELL